MRFHGITSCRSLRLPGYRTTNGAAWPTFEAIQDCAISVGAAVVSVPLNQNLAHDLDAMLAHTPSPTGLVDICNPNNPTSTITPRADLERFIGKLPPTKYVLVDEAYHHYAGQSAAYASFIDRPSATIA